MPIDFTDPQHRYLCDQLAMIYYLQDLLIGVVRRAGIPLQYLHFAHDMAGTWQETLQLAANMGKLPDLLRTVESDPRAAGILDAIHSFRTGTGSSRAPGFPDVDPAALLPERVLAKTPTFLEIGFLKEAIQASSAVCKLDVIIGRERFLGTGFLIDPSTILTNHHVLFDAGSRCSRVTAVFDYETGLLTAPANDPMEIELDPTTIHGNASVDWAVANLPEPLERPPLRLAKGPVKLGERLSIIQHPSGTTKKIAIHHSAATRIEEDVIYYLTDTEPGSSGSPVLNDSWEVVALHRACKELPQPNKGEPTHANVGIPINKVHCITKAGE